MHAPLTAREPNNRMQVTALQTPLVPLFGFQEHLMRGVAVISGVKSGDANFLHVLPPFFASSEELEPVRHDG